MNRSRSSILGRIWKPKSGRFFTKNGNPVFIPQIELDLSHPGGADSGVGNSVFFQYPVEQVKQQPVAGGGGGFGENEIPEFVAVEHGRIPEPSDSCHAKIVPADSDSSAPCF